MTKIRPDRSSTLTLQSAGRTIRSQQPQVRSEKSKRRSATIVTNRDLLPSYFREGRLVTLLLLSSLYLLLALSLDAAEWVESMGLLIPIAIGGIAMGALMAFSRFDGFFMLSHSFSTGLAWVVFLMTRLVGEERQVALFVNHGMPELQARAYFLLDRWFAWLAAAFNNAASNDNYVFIFEISFLVWWLSYLGAWTVFRNGHVWRGVVMAGIAILINTYYAPTPVTGFLIAYCVLAMLLLAWTNLIANRQRWRFLRIYFNQDIGFDFMRTGVFYTLAVISLAFVAPSLGRSASFRQVLQPVNARWEATTQEWNRLYQGLNRQTRPVASGFGRTLTLGGARNVSDRPIIEVEAGRGRYWRAVSFDHYSGRQWINTASEDFEIDANERIPTINWNSRTPLTQTVTLLAPTGSVILAAPEVLVASVPLAGLLSPIHGPGADGQLSPSEGEVTWSRSRAPLDVGESYTVISSLTEVTERELRSITSDYPTEIAERYLQLPDDFSPRVAELAAEVTAGEDTTYDKVKNLERHLRSYEYDEAIEAPGPEQDPIEYFLFDIQRGYCDYYATSMAVMLRSQGIPARTASGYAEGTYDRESGTFVVTERDAHTWVEVFFPGYGWIEFEPTAGESVLSRPSGVALQDSGLIPGAPLEEINEDPFFGEGGLEEFGGLGEELLQNQGGEGGFTSSRNWILYSVLLTLAALAGGWWLMRRRTYQGPSDYVTAPEIFYDRLTVWTERLRLALEDGLTPYERSSRLSEALPAGRSMIEQITEIYVRFRYAPRGNSGNESGVQNNLESSWRQLRPVLWKAWWRQLIGREEKGAEL